MKIVDKYILREYLVPFFYCLIGFSLLYILSDLFGSFSDFIDSRSPLRDIVFFYAHYLIAVNGATSFVIMILPIALLLSALYTLVNFARHNELTAMRASGMSIQRLVVPFIGVGLVCTIAGLALQETLVPKATVWIAEFRATSGFQTTPRQRIIRDYLYHTGESRRYWLVGEFDPAHPDRLVDVKVTQDTPDGNNVAEEIYADRAAWLDGTWWFYGVRSQRYDEQGEPVGGIVRAETDPAEMLQFPESPTDFVNEMRQPVFMSSMELLDYLQTHPSLSGSTRVRRLVDLHARLAMPCACIVLVLLALPTGTTTGRKGAFLSILTAVLLLFTFYFTVQFALILGKQGLIVPWLAAWLPNILFMTLGVVLTIRIQ